MARLFGNMMEILSLGVFVGMVWVWAALASAPGV